MYLASCICTGAAKTNLEAWVPEGEGLNTRRLTECHIKILLVEALSTARPGAGLLSLHRSKRTGVEPLHGIT